MYFKLFCSVPPAAGLLPPTAGLLPPTASLLPPTASFKLQDCAGLLTASCRVVFLQALWILQLFDVIEARGH